MPFFGVWSRALQFLFIESGARRGGEVESSGSSPVSSPSSAAVSEPSKGGGAAAAMARRAADARFPLLAVSPEATTKPEHCLLRFKSGAFVSGRPVLPICLDYRRNSARRGGKASGSEKGDGKKDGKAPSSPSPWSLAGALADLLSDFFDLFLDLFNFNPGWGLLENDAFHVLRAYMSPWTPLSVEALPLMRPRAAEGGKGEGEGRTAETAPEFAERVRRAMSVALDAPLVDLGVEDWGRLKAAGVAVDATGTRVLWRPGGVGKERVEVEVEEEEEEKKEA